MSILEKESVLLQVRLDKNLKHDAEALFEAMGLSASAAIKMFYAQTVNCGGIPFRPSTDPFYSKENQERLTRSMEQMEKGDTVTITL